MRVVFVDAGEPQRWVMCQRCGAVVAEQDGHTAWHRENGDPEDPDRDEDPCLGPDS